MKHTLLLIAIIFQPLNCLFAQKFNGMAEPMDFKNFSEDTLTILSWNVEHFVDSNNSPYIRNEKEDKPDTALVSKKIALLAEAIRKSGADIVVLQEFESRILAMQIARNKLKELGFQFFAGNESPDWYMNVIIMSKLPIGITYGYGSMYSPVIGFKDSTGRQETQNNINTRIISAEIRVNPSLSMVLTGVHLKAGGKDKDMATRLGQIELIKGQNRRFLNEDPKTGLIILGDFNATPDSQELKLFKSGKKNEAMIDPLEGKDIFSHPSDNPSRRIDHILLNAVLQPFLVPDSVKPYMPFAKEVMQEFSDHLPMTAKFLLKK